MWRLDTGGDQQAVCQFLKGETTAAASLLQSLFEDLDAVDDGCAVGVCLLLTDIHLKNENLFGCRQTMQALERVFSSDPHFQPIDWESKDDAQDTTWVDDQSENNEVPLSALSYPQVGP